MICNLNMKGDRRGGGRQIRRLDDVIAKEKDISEAEQK